MKFLVGLVVILVIFSPAFRAEADFNQESWEFRSKVEGGSISKADYAVLELSSDFFAHLQPDLSDLRVVNQDGEVPYVAAIERGEDALTSVPARMFNLSSVPGDTTSFIVDVGQAGVFHNSITIETPSENFRRIVQIEGSNDQNSWRVLNPRGQIFDYTVRDIKPVKVRDTNVVYPDSTFRYLRVTIYNYEEGRGPLTVNGVKTARRVSLAAREISYTPAMEISENSEDRTTDVILDLGTQGVPHRSGRVTTANVNFNRAAAIYDSNDKTDWRLLTHAYIFVIEAPKFTGSNLDFSYPESNRRYLKLSVINRDDRSITVSGVTLSGLLRRILFFFDPTKQYYVYLGNPKVKRPQYDIEKISQYVDAVSLDRVSAGEVISNPFYKPPIVPPLPLTERWPYLLPTLLGMVVATLAFLLLRLVVKTRSS